MEMKKTLLLLLAAALALGLMLTGCKKEEAAIAPVKIGVLVPLTGPLAEFGQGFRLACDLASEQLGEAGIQVDLKYADTETAAIPGVEAARTLVNVEKVVALIGAAASGVTIPVAESVSIPNEIPQISNASTSPLITYLPADEGKDFLFRTVPSDALQGVVLGKLAAEAGYKTAAVFYVNNPYGQGLLDEFKASFEAEGGKVVAAVPHDEKPAPTYVSELRQIMQSKPEVMLALSYPGQATVYLKEFFEAGYNKTTDLLFCDGTKSVEMPEALGAKNLAGFLGTAPGSVSGDSLTNFERDYKDKYGELPPLPYMTNIYDGVVIAALAAALAQDEDKPVNGVNVRDNLRRVSNPPGQVAVAGVDGLKKALQLLKDGKDINYEGAAGAEDFDKNGDTITPIEVWSYVEDEPYIETVRFETP
jgi:branched-chain amino acid transport system substrate-binding protein